MTAVGRPSVPRSLSGQGTRLAGMESGLNPWNYPTLINSWTDVGAPYSPVAYRFGVGPNTLEFKGHMTGGASGTVAFILLENFWPTNNISFLADIGDIGAFQVARIEIVAADGTVTVTFPAT